MGPAKELKETWSGDTESRPFSWAEISFPYVPALAKLFLKSKATDMHNNLCQNPNMLAKRKQLCCDPIVVPKIYFGIFHSAISHFLHKSKRGFLSVCVCACPCARCQGSNLGPCTWKALPLPLSYTPSPKASLFKKYNVLSTLLEYSNKGTKKLLHSLHSP